MAGMVAADGGHSGGQWARAAGVGAGDGGTGSDEEGGGGGWSGSEKGGGGDMSRKSSCGCIKDGIAFIG